MDRERRGQITGFGCRGYPRSLVYNRQILVAKGTPGQPAVEMDLSSLGSQPHLVGRNRSAYWKQQNQCEEEPRGHHRGLLQAQGFWGQRRAFLAIRAEAVPPAYTAELSSGTKHQ